MREFRGIDLTGQRFGRLKVVGLLAPARAGRHSIWWCRCDCGNIKTSTSYFLRRGGVQSCGCGRLGARYRSTKPCLPGVGTHGRHPLRPTWGSMWQRCANPKCPSYASYGARGIKVCDRWKSLALFIEDMGPKPTPDHSLDRIDSSGGYEPSNCRWATKREQILNRRNTKFVCFRGESRTLGDWAREFGRCPATVNSRLHRGWSLEAALTTPTLRRGSWGNKKGDTHAGGFVSGL